MLIVLVPVKALASGSPLVTQTFANNSTPIGQWSVPPAPSGWTDNACLTAGPVVATTSIPNCASPPDASGGGALRLTNNGGSQIGAVFYQSSLPTSQGLDITFDTYQYDGTGADGIAFTLAAANPANPTPPTATGPQGGDLGYAANTTGSPGTAGIPYGYLGIGLDVYGNFANTPLAGGTGCTEPSPLLLNTAYPESVTARGPGNGTTGYCILGSTATTYNEFERRRQQRRHDHQRRHRQHARQAVVDVTHRRSGAGRGGDRSVRIARHHRERPRGAGQLLDPCVHTARHVDPADAAGRAAHHQQQRRPRDVPVVVDRPDHGHPVPAHLRMDGLDGWVQRVSRRQSGRRLEPARVAARSVAEHNRQ